MGIYIDPLGTTKKEFLRDFGFPSSARVSTDQMFLTVCLVDNGLSCALAVIYDNRELEAFTQENYRRSRLWYLVSRDNIKNVLPRDLFDRLERAEGRQPKLHP